ncbi:MAG: hypothetical protein LBD63_02785 [Mycoplasmataceae bacterium]|jgi:hypothetical protein|nr:hypothetical protein [Mycoplasmataceae bacterium]
MTIVKKDISKDGKTFYTIIDENFKLTKKGNGVIARIGVYFPNTFVQTSKDGKHKYINVGSEKLLDSIMIARDKDEPAVTVPEPVKTEENK